MVYRSDVGLLVDVGTFAQNCMAELEYSLSRFTILCRWNIVA